MRRLIFAVLLGLPLLGGVPAQAGLLINGGFESGDLTGWTDANTHDPGVTIVEALVYSLEPLSASGFHVALRPALGVRSLRQTILTTPGERFGLQFDVAALGDGAGTLQVLWNETLLAEIPGGDGFAYRRLSFAVIATGVDTLYFQTDDNLNTFFLDNVSIPEPGGLALFATALLLLSLGPCLMRRRAGD